MASTVQNSGMSIPPLAGAVPRMVAPESSQPPQTPDGSDSTEAPEIVVSVLQAATGSTAVGYYLSTLLHLLAYGAAAVAFTVAGQLLTEDSVTTPIRASLDDFDRAAEQPQFEVVAEIGLSDVDGQTNIQQLSNSLQAVENGQIETMANAVMPSSLNTKDAAKDEGTAGDFLFKLPESGLAVTKGSFTVWTEPEAPDAGQPYLIIIEVRLPSDTRAYRVNDLSGYVIGSDKYRQKIPYDSTAPHNSFFTDEDKKLQQMSSSERINVRGNKVQLAIKVPGASRLVKDTIQIHSRKLRERQELELVFGSE